MSIRSIEHPSVEVRETDLSLVAPNLQMTTALINGFSNIGEDLTPTFISNMLSYQTLFGKPTTDAERYSYYSVREVLNNQGNVYFARLPYDNEARGQYRCLGFDLESNYLSGSVAVSELFELATSASYVKRIEVDGYSGMISASGLDNLRTSNDFSELESGYSTKSFIVVNKTRNALEGQNENEGLMVVVLPAYNSIAYQNQNASWFDAPSAPYEGWAIMSGMQTPSSVADGVQTLWDDDDWVIRPDSRYTIDSISKDLSREFPIFQYPLGKLDRRFTNHLTVLVLKTFIDINNGSKLNYQLVEKFTGSLGRNDLDPATGKSIFLGSLINSGSQYIEFYFNSSYDVNTIVLNNSATSGAVYSVYQGIGPEYASSIVWPAISFSKQETRKSILVADVLESLELIFSKMSNLDETRLDLVIDAGLSNITQYIFNHIPADPTAENAYSPETWDVKDSVSSRYNCEYWQSVVDLLINFCQMTRKDCMAIIDAPRAISLEGNEKVVRSTRPQNTIDGDILPKLKFITSSNSSYGAGYTTWHKRVDQFTGVMFWEPPTIKAAGIYCNTDLNFNFFEAPYGLTRGLISEVVDISFSPGSKQEDQIYLKNWNYTKEFPSEGFVLWGQKTFQAAPSALDRINVRRLFLKLERHAYDVSRYFIGVLNNFYNRSRLLSVLDPKFSEVQRLGGMYEYKLICDETNNTPEIIDNNELKLAVMIKPARVSDFILVDFYAMRTGASFEEVIL
jgi:hypothetical protein